MYTIPVPLGCNNYTTTDTSSSTTTDTSSTTTTDTSITATKSSIQHYLYVKQLITTV